jgi:hypothetical protein
MAIAATARATTAVTISRPPESASRETNRALEEAVRETLTGTTEPLDVQFSTWLAEDGHVQFVCRVEAPPADPFGGEIQWRWWSPLFDDADGLREALAAAVASRGRARRSAGLSEVIP